jgi:hypothetical protein
MSVSWGNVYGNQADAYGWIPRLDDTLRHNYSLPVGPDFGAGYQKTNCQYGRSCSELLQQATANSILGRNRNTAAQTNYDDLV